MCCVTDTFCSWVDMSVTPDSLRKFSSDGGSKPGVMQKNTVVESVSIRAKVNL